VLNQEKLFRILRFSIVSFTVKFIDFGLAWVLSRWLSPLMAVSIAFVTAGCCHFLLNKMWVFHCSRTDYATQVGQYALAVAGSGLTTLGVVRLSLLTITSNILLAKLIAQLPATLVGFALLRFIVFASKRKSTISIADLQV
jgi:putative flippase GtrA